MQKGVLFLGKNFAIGILGNTGAFNLDILEKACRDMSTKEVKVSKKDEVKFVAKTKGAKPVVTKGIAQFSITGDGFNVEKLSELMKANGFSMLD